MRAGSRAKAVTLIDDGSTTATVFNYCRSSRYIMLFASEREVTKSHNDNNDGIKRAGSYSAPRCGELNKKRRRFEAKKEMT